MGALMPAAAALRGRVIGVYASGGAPWHHLALAAAHGAAVRPVRAEDIAAGRLDELDALIVPGGGALAMAGLLAPLGEAGATRIRDWVGAGGTYVSSCAGSVLPLALADEAAALLPSARCLRMTDVALANPGDATLGGLASPGVGIIRVRLSREHPFSRELPAEIELMHYNGPLFDVAAAEANGVRPFAWPSAATDAFTPAERFLAGEHVDDHATTFARCVVRHAATGMELDVGAGRALLFGSHPEFGLGPLLLGWGDGAALLVHALASCRSRRRTDADADPGWAIRPAAPLATVRELATGTVDALERLAERFEALAVRDLRDWLAPDHAASFHGSDARSAWQRDCTAAAHAARASALALGSLSERLGDADRGWLDDVPRDDQDVGAMGLRQLLERADAMVSAAERSADEPAQRPAHAYDLFDRHPFHLAVGSYLSAAGLVSAAALVVAVLGARHQHQHPALAALLWQPGAGPQGGTD